ncbi:unnamed protein product [Gordionus sp. m RMFG-2023]
MAKSLRSKRKRKFRAIKRVKNGVKELEKLKKVVINLKSLEDVVISKPDILSIKDSQKMEVIKQYNTKTHKDEHGQYPKWMNQRTVGDPQFFFHSDMTAKPGADWRPFTLLKPNSKGKDQ